MKLLFAMASISLEKGGPSTAVRALTAELGRLGHSVTVVSHDDGGGQTDYESDGVRYVQFRLTRRHWEYSSPYRKWIRENVRNYDSVLITSLFRSHTRFVSDACRRQHVHFGLRPHGSLNEKDLAGSHPFLKRVYLRTVDRGVLRDANYVFCTSEAEAKDARRWTRVEPSVIPLGVSNSLSQISREPHRESILYLSRIARKKGLDILLRAAARLTGEYPNLQLTIAGDSPDNLRAEMESLSATLGLSSTAHFVGSIGPEERAVLLATAGVFALPSEDENFGISVAEALAAGVPVVITPGVSHAGLVTEYGAGKVVERNPQAVSVALSELIGLSDIDYAKMSHNAKSLVLDSYSWERSAEELVGVIARSDVSHALSGRSA